MMARPLIVIFSLCLLVLSVSCLPLAPLSIMDHTPNVKVIHATNPQVMFTPESTCHRGFLGRCDRYIPWERRVYRSAIDGKLHSYYQTSNWENDPSGEQIRKMEVGVRGARQICLFGAPSSQLSRLAPAQQMCLDGSCTTIDVNYIYAMSDPDVPARLWCSGSINPFRFHRVELRLLEQSRGRDVKYITFHHLEYTALNDPPRLDYQLDHGETFVNSTVHSTSARIIYNPPYYNYNRKKHNPWDKVIYNNEHGHHSSFYRTSNWLNQHSGWDNRRATTVFQGSAVYVYGAPPSEVRKLGQQGFGKLQITLNTAVEPIDIEEIYLNIDRSQDYREVLIYSNENLDPRKAHLLQVQLLEGTSPLPHVVKTLTLSKIMITEVNKLPTPKTPGISYHVEHREASDLGYQPCEGWFNCIMDKRVWMQQQYKKFGWQERGFYRATSELADRQEISVVFQVPGDTTSLILKGPPRYMYTYPFARQVVDISGLASYPLDVEQAYLNIDPDQEEEPVTIFSTHGIPRRRSSRVITLRFSSDQPYYNFEGWREMAIETVGYTWEEGPSPPLSISPIIVGYFLLGFVNLAAIGYVVLSFLDRQRPNSYNHNPITPASYSPPQNRHNNILPNPRLLSASANQVGNAEGSRQHAYTIGRTGRCVKLQQFSTSQSLGERQPLLQNTLMASHITYNPPLYTSYVNPQQVQDPPPPYNRGRMPNVDTIVESSHPN